MFYSQFVLSKQGPLGTIWIAAHSANAAKLRKCQIVETDLGATCETIIHQTFNATKVPLALRLSGQLLLGVVRIYARKLELLTRDSEAALVDMRQASFAAAAAVDLAPEALTAPAAALTLPLDYEALDYYADPGASYQLQLEPIARGGEIDLADPFLGPLGATLGSQEDFEGYLPDGADDAPEAFRFATPGSASRSRRSSLGRPGLSGDGLGGLAGLGEEEEEMVPMPDDGDALGGYGGGLGDAELFGPTGTAPLGDSPARQAASPGGSFLGAGDAVPGDSVGDVPDGDDGYDDHGGSYDVAYDDEPGPAPQPAAGPESQTAAEAGAGEGGAPSTRPQRVKAPRSEAGEQEPLRKVRARLGPATPRKRKLRVDAVISLTNAQLRAAIADATDLLRPSADAGGAAGTTVTLDALLAQPASLSAAACAPLRSLFAAQSTRRGAVPAAPPAAEAAAGIEPLHLVDAGDDEGGWGDDGDYGDGGDDGYPDEDEQPFQRAASLPLAVALAEGDAEGDDALAPAGATPAEAAAGPPAWTQRTSNVLHVLQRRFQLAGAEVEAGAPPPPTPLSPLLEGQRRNAAARLLFELLVLGSRGFVQLEQRAPYGEVQIAPGEALAAAA